MPRKAQVITDLFNLYLEMTTEQQDDIRSMFESDRRQSGLSGASLAFVDLATHTLGSPRLNAFKTMVKKRTEKDSGAEAQAGIRKRKKQEA